MAHFFFIDESGQDHRESPYEVLSGVSVEDKNLWPLIVDIKKLERKTFGGAYRTPSHEVKAKHLLKRKTFRLAGDHAPIEPSKRTSLARTCLDDPTNPTREGLAALSQSKLAYTSGLFAVCEKYGCRIFASIIVDPNIESGHFLRKDYSYLFERFYEFLADGDEHHRGIVVFDEIGKTKSHLLIDQLSLYFSGTKKGVQRAARLIPEPFFVQSDLTTGILLADIAAYVMSWGYEHPLLVKERRPELAHLSATLARLRHDSRRTVGGKPFVIESIKVIAGLGSGGAAFEIDKESR